MDLYGTFAREDTNRFHYYVLVGGTEKLCYMPSNCKLEKIVSLSGREIFLKEYDKSSDKFNCVMQVVS